MEILLNGDCAFLTDKTSGARVVVRCEDGIFSISPVVNEHIGTSEPGIPNRVTVSAPPKNIVAFTATQMAFLYTAEDTFTYADHTTWLKPNWQNLLLDDLSSKFYEDRLYEVNQFYDKVSARFKVPFDRSYFNELKTIGAVYNYMMTLNPDLQLETTK